MPSAIEFRDVVKTFAKSRGGLQTVLKGVSFTIPAGKTTVIAGGSGQGKSVTLKLVLGLMQVDAGQVFVHDQDITRARGRELERLRTQFGVLFQGSALFDSLTVFENVALPLRERTEKSEAEIRTLVEASLGQFELAGHEEKYPAQLSGGMQKRVGLARAMQLKPRIMLFDEPTTGLDPRSVAWLVEFIQQQRQVGRTVITATHDLVIAEQVATKIYVFNEDHSIETAGLPQDILKDHTLLHRCNLSHYHTEPADMH